MSAPNHTTEILHASRGRHTSINQYGEMCMTVVDPVSRKLLIPVQYVYRTRAQQRNTLPSLCLLFLNRRCRQAGECYQVHANREVVQLLRNEIDSLPCCCVAHGDADRTADGEPPRDATVVYLPGCKPSTFNGGYLPIDRLSYTVALRRLLQGPCTTAEAAPDCKVLDASGCTICRLHALDRCRYAEDCKFLHVCKEITATNPELIAQANGHDSIADVSTTSMPDKAAALAPPVYQTPFAQSHSEDTALNVSGTRGAHVSVFTTVTRRQQQQQQQHDQLRRSTQPQSFSTPAPGFYPYGGHGSSMPTPFGSTADLSAPRGNHIGTWLATQPMRQSPLMHGSQTQQLYSMPNMMSGSFGAGVATHDSCSSFQDSAAMPMIPSSVPAYAPGVEGSHSFSTVGYSNTSFQPMSPVKVATAVSHTVTAPNGSRKPLLVPICEGSLTAAPQTPAAQTAAGALESGSLGQDAPLPGEGEGQTQQSSDNDERASPCGDASRRRDARDPSRWSYNPYGSSLVSL